MAREDDCCVCLAPLEEDERVRVLDCGHAFHEACVEPWLEERRRCPTCRGEVSPCSPGLEGDDPFAEERHLLRSLRRRRPTGIVQGPDLLVDRTPNGLPAQCWLERLLRGAQELAGGARAPALLPDGRACGLLAARPEGREGLESREGVSSLLVVNGQVPLLVVRDLGGEDRGGLHACGEYDDAPFDLFEREDAAKARRARRALLHGLSKGSLVYYATRGAELPGAPPLRYDAYGHWSLWACSGRVLGTAARQRDVVSLQGRQ
jgi:hypothetical protein